MKTMNVTVKFDRTFKLTIDDSLTPQQKKDMLYTVAFNYIADLIENNNLGAEDFSYFIEEEQMKIIRKGKTS